jgi:hypothetical protein
MTGRLSPIEQAAVDAIDPRRIERELRVVLAAGSPRPRFPMTIGSRPAWLPRSATRSGMSRHSSPSRMERTCAC